MSDLNRKGWAWIEELDEMERLYYTSDDLRSLAEAVTEIADYLDGRERFQPCGHPVSAIVSSDGTNYCKLCE